MVNTIPLPLPGRSFDQLRLLPRELLPAPDRHIHVTGLDLHGKTSAARLLRGDDLAAGTRKRFIDNLCLAGVVDDRPEEELDRLLGRVDAIVLPPGLPNGGLVPLTEKVGLVTAPPAVETELVAPVVIPPTENHGGFDPNDLPVDDDIRRRRRRKEGALGKHRVPEIERTLVRQVGDGHLDNPLKKSLELFAVHLIVFDLGEILGLFL